MNNTIFDSRLAVQCAELAARAYRECTFEGKHSTQVLLGEIDGVQSVAFRGSQEPFDFLTDAQVWRISYEAGELHAGFDRAFIGIEGRLLRELDLRRPVIFTGHSLGGALAVMAGFHMCSVMPVKAVYTFGQPRVGDQAFAQTYDRHLGARTMRFVHEEDLVPRLPGRLLGYRHLGQEIFLNSAGNVQVNPPLMDKVVSDVRGLCRGWRQRGPLGLATVLADHGMARYLDRVKALQTANDRAVQAEEEFRAQQVFGRPPAGENLHRSMESPKASCPRTPGFGLYRLPPKHQCDPTKEEL